MDKDEALRLALRLCEEALPKFNWGASCLDANAIQLLNTVPAAIKAALAQPAQEPCDMGAMCLGCEPRNPDGSCPDARPPQEDEEVCSHCGSYCHERDELDKAEREIVRLQKIIDAPKREWVGLTDEEITKIINANLLTGLWDMAKEIEAKLKEKNNG